MKYLVSGLTLSLATASPAFAAKKEDKSPWYIQVSVGSVVSSESEDKAAEALADYFVGAPETQLDFSTGYHFEVGYRLTDNWSMTAGYMDFGDTAFSVNGRSISDSRIQVDMANIAPKYGNGNSYSIVYSTPLIDQFRLSIDFGLLYLESTSTTFVGEPSSFNLPQTYSDHSLQYFGSAGIDYTYKKFQAGLYYRHYDIDSIGTEWLGVRLGYHF